MTKRKKMTRKPTIVTLILGLLLICTCQGNFAAGSKSRIGREPPSPSTRPIEITRRIQSWMIQQRAIPKTRSLNHQRRRTTRKDTVRRRQQQQQGSLFTFERPNMENVGRWFGVDEDAGNLRCMLRRQFNHDSVGMTNPSLGLSGLYSDVEKNNLCLTVSTSKKVQSDSSTSGPDVLVDKSWWPSLSFAPSQPQKWRVLTYREKVGKGMACYNRVRDAALDWKFRVGDDMGILPVARQPEHNVMQYNSGNHRGRYTVLPDKENDQQNEIVMHQCIGAARRFASFSSRRILPFLPKIYSVNPIMSVFDIVDQRGPSTLYSSTAYATMKGHLLRGEERVTVALRDGSEDVEVEIISISRSAPSLAGRTVWPFIGKMQSSFFEAQIGYLRQVGLHYAQPRIATKGGVSYPSSL